MLFLLLAFVKKILKKKKKHFLAYGYLWRCASAGKQKRTAYEKHEI